MKTGQWAQAVKDAEVVIQADPHNVKAWFRLAQSQIKLKDFPSARSAYEQCKMCGGVSEEDLSQLHAEINTGEQELKSVEKKKYQKLFS